MQLAFYLSVLGALLIAISFDYFDILLLLGVALSIWVIGGALTDLFEKFRATRKLSTFNLLNGFVLNRLEIGKNVSHIGVGFLIFGITMVSSLETEVIKEVGIGERFNIGKFEVVFNGVERKKRLNYISDTASLTFISKDEKFEINPEKRFYASQKMITSEVALKQKVTNDLYAVLGESKLDKNSQKKSWILRVYIKPFISFLWFGAMLIAVGGILSLLMHRKKISNIRFSE